MENERLWGGLVAAAGPLRAKFWLRGSSWAWRAAGAQECCHEEAEVASYGCPERGVFNLLARRDLPAAQDSIAVARTMSIKLPTDVLGEAAATFADAGCDRLVKRLVQQQPRSRDRRVMVDAIAKRRRLRATFDSLRKHRDRVWVRVARVLGTELGKISATVAVPDGRQLVVPVGAVDVQRHLGADIHEIEDLGLVVSVGVVSVGMVAVVRVLRCEARLLESHGRQLMQ